MLRVNPLLLLGGLAGAQTFTPGLAAVQGRSGSAIAVLGYSGSVAIAHVLIPMWGAVIVALMSRECRARRLSDVPTRRTSSTEMWDITGQRNVDVR